MSKNVVICLDGTGNQFDENNSNVVNLFRVIKRDASQIAYYDPGVGTLADPDYKTPVGKKLSKLMGLGFGKGLTRNVQQAYSFLMNHYEKGDRLFLFGFSRGGLYRQGPGRIHTQLRLVGTGLSKPDSVCDETL